MGHRNRHKKLAPVTYPITTISDFETFSLISLSDLVTADRCQPTGEFGVKRFSEAGMQDFGPFGMLVKMKDGSNFIVTIQEQNKVL